MDIIFSALTGERITSAAYPQVATDMLSAKLQSTPAIRIQYATPGSSGSAYVPCAAPGGTALKFALKPQQHYADTSFEVYTDSFTAPTDPTQATAFYTGTLSIDSTALRALFPVGTDGTSPDYVDLIGEVTSGGVPTQTFTVRIYNNVIKGTEPPAVAAPGPSGYPTAAAVSALLTPYQVTAAVLTAGSNHVALPAGVRAVTCAASLTNDAYLAMPPASGYPAGTGITFALLGSTGGHYYFVGPGGSDTVDSTDDADHGLFDNTHPAYTEITLLSDGVSDWQFVPQAAAGVTSVAGSTGVVTTDQIAAALAGKAIAPSSVTTPTLTATGELDINPAAGIRLFGTDTYLSNNADNTLTVLYAGTSQAGRIRFGNYGGTVYLEGTADQLRLTDGSGNDRDFFARSITASSTLSVASTLTAAGTTGVQTINKQRGTVRLAAGQAVLSVTNSLVTATSKIAVHATTIDGTATAFRAAAASGSFTIYANATATGETEVVFDVLIF